MTATLPEFGDAVFWQTPLQEVYLPEDESPNLDTDKCSASLGGSAIRDDQMIEIEEECSDPNHPEESANISSNMTMVSVEFSLNEETLLFAEEVHEAVRRVEALVRKKSNTFVALEWVGVQKGKMEVVVRNKVVAEALVKQLSNTLWHPSLSVVATLNIVPSLSNSIVAEQAKHLEEETKSCVNLAIPPIEDSTSRELPNVKEDLNEGILKKKKVTGKTSDDRLKQHMMNYMIGKIELLDDKIRLSKGEQLLVQEEIEVLDQDILKLEDELEECRQSCSSTLGVMFPAMDIRLKSNLVKNSGVQAADKQPALNHKDQSMVHSDDQGGMLEHDQVIGKQRDAGLQVEDLNHEDNIVETAREGQPEGLEVNINDEQCTDPKNGPNTPFGARDGDNPVIVEEVEHKNKMDGEEVVEGNFVIRDENIVHDIAVKDELKPDVVSPTNVVEEAAFVPKAVEYIVDCDSD